MIFNVATNFKNELKTEYILLLYVKAEIIISLPMNKFIANLRKWLQNKSIGHILINSNKPHLAFNVTLFICHNGDREQKIIPNKFLEEFYYNPIGKPPLDCPGYGSSEEVQLVIPFITFLIDRCQTNYLATLKLLFSLPLNIQSVLM